MSSGQMLPGQMSLWLWHMAFVKDGSRNLPLKFGQNRFSNSRNIADIDKCCKVKFCLDKCHHDSWFLLKMVVERLFWSLVKIGWVTANTKLNTVVALAQAVNWGSWTPCLIFFLQIFYLPPKKRDFQLISSGIKLYKKSLPYKSTLKNYEKFEGGKLRTPKILSNLFIFLTHPSA